MDITLLFKACVKTIRTRNKAFGPVNLDQDKNRILPHRTTRKDEFTTKAKDVLGQITRLRDFLLEHRRAYLNFSGHLASIPKMSDIERDKIDSGAQKIMKTCSNLILEFQRDSWEHNGSQQFVEHQQAMLDLINDYLKAVCKIYSEQKAIRVKRTLETQKLSKLEPEPTTHRLNDTKPVFLTEKGKLSTQNIPTITVLSTLPPSESDTTSSLQFSAEELQMFESENEQLYNELNSTNDEVRQIESKVVRIAELQEIFTEKVLDQEKDIERIVSTVVGTTENLRDANTQIRQAIQSSAGLRVYILFFLLVMSFSLLFLDWYND